MGKLQRKPVEATDCFLGGENNIPPLPDSNKKANPYSFAGMEKTFSVQRRIGNNGLNTIPRPKITGRRHAAKARCESYPDFGSISVFIAARALAIGGDASTFFSKSAG